MSTARDIVRRIYARALAPERFPRMTPDEMDWMLAKHRKAIDIETKAVQTVIDRARHKGVSELHNRFRNAEGVDPDMIDQIAAGATIGEVKSEIFG